MKKIILAVIPLALVVGCGGSQSHAKPSNTASAASPTGDHVTRRQAYVRVVRGHYPQTDRLTDDDLVRIAQDVCSLIDEGESLQTIYDTVNQGTNGAAPAIVGAGVAAYCPQYQYLFN